MITLISSFDLWFENLMLSLRTPVFLDVSGAITFLGNAPTVIGITGLVGAYLVFSRKRVYALGLATTLLGAVASTYVLKEIVARPRPSALVTSIVETGFSFPSWHAVASVALYGFLAYVLARFYPNHRKAIFVAASVIIVSIGMSRLYLGVHFPSDVLAGYALGGLWLTLGIRIVRKLQVSSGI